MALLGLGLRVEGRQACAAGVAGADGRPALEMPVPALHPPLSPFVGRPQGGNTERGRGTCRQDKAHKGLSLVSEIHKTQNPDRAQLPCFRLSVEAADTFHEQFPQGSDQLKPLLLSHKS